jgi:hypothetical protein
MARLRAWFSRWGGLFVRGSRGDSLSRRAAGLLDPCTAGDSRRLDGGAALGVR